jgi:EAL domain-containing protein (putative c-di-GMP-specific phosphodiesterase class I)
MRGRVLLVDDEPIIRRAYVLALESAGHQVVVAADGLRAAELAKADFDVIISDIAMPGISGLNLLRQVRERDPDLPVILMTGRPGFESAVDAVQLHALRYLTKPLELAELLDAVQEALRTGALAKLRAEAVRLLGDGRGRLLDRATLQGRLDRALAKLWIAFQPIVQYSTQTTFAFECLLRSDEPTLSTPGPVLAAAEELGGLGPVGQGVRALAAAALADPQMPRLFVNLHAADLLDDQLFATDSPLSSVASRVVLEVTERASLETVDDVRGRVRALRSLGFRVAIDDLGSGYAGLTSFAQLEPDFVKLDLALIRNLHLEPTQRKLVRSIIRLCEDLGIQAIAEGVETPAERDALLEMGCDLLQGYLFARPARSPPAVRW